MNKQNHKNLNKDLYNDKLIDKIGKQLALMIRSISHSLKKQNDHNLKKRINKSKSQKKEKIRNKIKYQYEQEKKKIFNEWGKF